jgi:hypothetical protein
MAKLYYGELREVGGGERPGHGLPPSWGGSTDPGWGIDEGGAPDQGLPVPPPGMPGHPIQPVPPEAPGQLPIPPGTIWPPLGGAQTGKVWAFVWIRGYGHRWVVLDASSKPELPARPGGPGTLPSR